MFEFGPENKSTLWAWAAAIGVIAFLIFMLAMGYTFWPAFFLGVLIAILVALLLWIGFYRDDAAEAAPEPVAPVEKPVAATNVPAMEASVAEPDSEPSARGQSTASGMMGAAGEKLVKDATKPEGLDGPRGGTADDLKMIKGVGPKLEQLLNSMGFYHFDQIADWSEHEVAWVDNNLQGFKGRVTRDNWIAQAKTLAAGGETEFSKRVEGGDVY